MVLMSFVFEDDGGLVFACSANVSRVAHVNEFIELGEQHMLRGQPAQEALVRAANRRNAGEVEELLTEIRSAEESLKAMRRNEKQGHTLKMVNNTEPNVKQIDIEVKVSKTKIKAIVDCGADVDYVNKAWCEQKQFPITELGDGWMEGYDAIKKRTKIQDAEIKFSYQGVTQTRKFRVVPETGEDILVLGMPWLQELNPEVDWKERKVTLRKQANEKDEGKTGTSASKLKRIKSKKDSTKSQPKEESKRTRGGYGGDQTRIEKSKRQQEIAEIEQKLPEELKEYAEVFCQTE